MEVVIIKVSKTFSLTLFCMKILFMLTKILFELQSNLAKAKRTSQIVDMPRIADKMFSPKCDDLY